MNITQMLCPSSKYGTKCPYSMTPTGVVVHNTANDASAMAEVSYMLGNANETSFHYAVDDTRAVQGISENRNAWHAGDGNGKGNRQGIAVEICYSKSGGSRFASAEKNGAQLVAWILKRHGWGIDRVTKHQDYSGKYCPHRTLDLGWQRFLSMVRQYLSETASVKSDTTCDMKMKPGASYIFKLTSAVEPNVTIGSGGVLTYSLTKQAGSDYFYKLTAVGKAGQGAGIYANDKRIFSVTIS